MYVNHACLSNGLKANLYGGEEFCVPLVSLVLKPTFFESENVLHDE